MDHRRPDKRVCVFPIVLVLAAALLSACGSSTENMPPATGTVLSASTPTAGLNACTGCHLQQTADWLTTRHANLDPAGNLYSYGIPTLPQVKAAGCSACHDPLGDSNNLTAGTTGQYGIKRPVIGCEACHGAGSLHVERGGVGPISLLSNTTAGTWGTGAVQVSAQFMMCTTCHGLLDSSGTGTGATHHDAASGTTPTGSQYTITDTHFAAVPATYGTSTTITGYAMDFESTTVCTGCHNPHRAADINRDWAASGHGDMTAGPWTRNWSLSSYAFCQRCHTTTGFMNYANANAAGDTATVSNIWNGLVSNFTNTNWKPEMLKCNGCHTSNRGALRNPGAYNATYGFRAGSPAKIYAYIRHQYPDASSSNVCILCHSGRNSGETIHVLNTAQAGTTATVNFANQSVSTAHDMTAAGSLFGAIGYEYDGRNYANPSSYRHGEIGTAAVSNTGTSGPCVGCHMHRTGMSASHLFTAVSKSADTITNVSSEVCFNCHAGSSTGLADTIETERLAFEDALQALDAQLRLVSLVTGSAFPRGTNATNWLSPGDSDNTGNTTGKNNMGAAFNRSFLLNENGAFVHNSKYVKRLIYDSIDWLDDNDLNYSVGSTLSDALGIHNAQPYQAGAMSYLLTNGVRPGAPAERPY